MSDEIIDLETAIHELATAGFASVTVGGQTTVVKSLDELLRYRDRLRADAAAVKPHFGVRFSKIVPPGAG